MSRWKRKKQREKRGLRMVKEDRRVAILCPCDDHVKTAFMASLVGMVKRTLLATPENLTALSFQTYGSTILPFSRQQLALYALNVGATHTLWIDSDMRFPDDMLLRFLKRDEPIIGINAMSRRPPFRCTAQSEPGKALVTTPDSSGLEKVHRMGFGVMWIATEVFRNMDLPYFDFEYVPDLQCFRGEDYAFFEKARQQGHEFYVDHDLSKEIEHRGEFGYNPCLMGMMEAPEERD